MKPVYNNIFSNYFAGIMLNGPNGASIDADQGGLGDAWDNITASLIIYTQQDAGVMVDCSAQSNNQNRGVRFGRTVGDSLIFEVFEEENTWFARSYAYVSMSRDSTIIFQDTLTDAPFISFYNEADSSNIGRFQLVACLSPDSASRVSASSLNLSITPLLDLETALQTVWDKYLTIVAAGDTLTGSDTLLLEQVGDLDYFSGGRAIYMAAAMLGKEVNPSIPPLRINPGNVNIPDPQSPAIKKQIKIYPNPATEYFVLTGSDIEFKGVTLYDMHNKKVMEWDYILPDLPVSLNVISGIYAIRVITQNNEVYWGKLAIIGR